MLDGYWSIDLGRLRPATGGGSVGLPNSIETVLELLGAASLCVSVSVGLTAIVLDALDRYRYTRARRPAKG
jgi:hypothetical protein